MTGAPWSCAVHNLHGYTWQPHVVLRTPCILSHLTPPTTLKNIEFGFHITNKETGLEVKGFPQHHPAIAMKPGFTPVVSDSEAPIINLMQNFTVLLQNYNKLIAMEETFFIFYKDFIYF